VGSPLRNFEVLEKAAVQHFKVLEIADRCSRFGLGDPKPLL
jgi:hypothetical protein